MLTVFLGDFYVSVTLFSFGSPTHCSPAAIHVNLVHIPARPATQAGAYASASYRPRTYPTNVPMVAYPVNVWPCAGVSERDARLPAGTRQRGVPRQLFLLRPNSGEPADLFSGGRSRR